MTEERGDPAKVSSVRADVDGFNGALDRAAGPLATIAVYLLVRAVGVAMLAWVASRNGNPLSLQELLSQWDGEWYIGLASDGYEGADQQLGDLFGNRDATTPFGFLPGYPLLVRAVALLPGLGVVGTGLWLNVVAGSIGALGIARLGRLVVGSERAALLLVALFAGAPMGLALSMTYTEAAFTALAAWALVGVLERNWMLAGTCAMASGLVRSTSAALVLAVVLAAGWAWWRRPVDRSPLIATVLAPIGLSAWFVYVAVRTRRWDGWFELRQRGWGDGLSAAPDRWRHLVDVLAGRNTELVDIMSVAAAMAAVALLVLCVRLVPWPLTVYAGATICIVCLTVGFNTANSRLLLPASFVLLMPVASELAERSTRVQIGSTAAFVLVGSWFSAYALAVYPFAI